MLELELDVVGEHAEGDVRPHPLLEAVVDRPDLELGRLHRPEGPPGLGELLVGADDRRSRELFAAQARAQDVDAVERFLGGDRTARGGCTRK